MRLPCDAPARPGSSGSARRCGPQIAQQAHVEEFMAQDVDVLIIAPKDTSLTQVVADAQSFRQ